MVHEEQCEKACTVAFITSHEFDHISKVFALLDARLQVFTKYSAKTPGAIEEIAAQYISAEITPIWNELFSLGFTEAAAAHADISGAEYACYKAGKA